MSPLEVAYRAKVPCGTSRFPFDEQQCHLKFGSWTYSENLLNLELLENNVRYEEEVNEQGIVDNITIATMNWLGVIVEIVAHERRTRIAIADMLKVKS
ncbi:hypothetical protein OSTOST_25284 [Ostertagia ostertagi]